LCVGELQSVIVGKRDDVSDTRRAIIGSSSQSVLSSCGMPVTVVQSDSHASWM
jgi:nucleotide-binding universal stress UspA family protein